VVKDQADVDRGKVLVAMMNQLRDLTILREPG